MKRYFVRDIKHLFYIIFCGPELTTEYRRNYRLYGTSISLERFTIRLENIWSAYAKLIKTNTKRTRVKNRILQLVGERILGTKIGETPPKSEMLASLPRSQLRIFGNNIHFLYVIQVLDRVYNVTFPSHLNQKSEMWHYILSGTWITIILWYMYIAFNLNISNIFLPFWTLRKVGFCIWGFKKNVFMVEYVKNVNIRYIIVMTIHSKFSQKERYFTNVHKKTT